jgi:hypothetical protein
VSELRRHWREAGPPTHIAVAHFAAAWGVKLTGDPEPDAITYLEPPKGSPTIAELSEGISVVPGGDTLAASQAVLKRLHQS